MITDKLDSNLVAECMQHGLSDFIIKPLKSEELIKKVEKVAGPVEGNEADAGYDILLVDDGPRVPDALRGELPDVFSVFSATNRDEAIALCADHEFKLIIVDTVIPDEDSEDLSKALREKVPNARVAALYPRKVKYPGIRASEKGYDGFLVKPFVETQITTLLNPDGQSQADQSVLVRSDTLLQVRQPEESDPAVVFAEASKGILSAIEELAADCCDEVILDLRQMPSSDGLPGFLEETMQHCMNVCIEPKVVGPDGMASMLPDGTPFFSCVTEILDG
jgi:DNA-binding NarL/FixJ family response regulator